MYLKGLGENSEQRIERVKGLLSRYKPRIEAVSGVHLGDVDVRDYEVADAVKIYGESALLQIPKDWQRIGMEMNSKQKIMGLD